MTDVADITQLRAAAQLDDGYPEWPFEPFEVAGSYYNPLAFWARAITAPIEDIAHAAADSEDAPSGVGTSDSAGLPIVGWARLFDSANGFMLRDAVLADELQAARWAAQAVGVRITPDAEDAVAEVLAAEGMKRGTRASVAAAAARFLTGDKTVIVRTRTDPTNPGVDEAWHLTIRTRTVETPDADLVVAAINRVLPIGIILHHIVADGWTYLEMDAYEASYDLLDAEFGSYDDMDDQAP